jgi:phosphate transport system permease protein
MSPIMIDQVLRDNFPFSQIQEDSLTRIIRTQQHNETIGFGLLRVCMAIVALLLFSILGIIIWKGFGTISIRFLTESPKMGMTQGGIFPAILGTLCVSVVSAILSIPLGMGCAIYLVEYTKDSSINRIIRTTIRNLSGVPSIVYGLFGVVLFVKLMHMGTSILAAGATLGLMSLPWTITASEEALKAIPNGFREGALALGATRWMMIRTVVLPYAIPGMLTGAILGLARAAGETAPILFTGAAFFLPRLPHSILDQFMALPYHLYVLATQHHNLSAVQPLAFGTALVLIALVTLMNGFAIWLRYKLRKKYQVHG